MSIGMREATSRAGDSRAVAASVVCESTACLPADLADRYGIQVIPIPFVFGDVTYLDGVDMRPDEFYERLARTKTPPKTSPPSPGAYLEAWAKAATSAQDVVSVTVNSHISTLQRSALLATRLAPEALPGARIHLVDSLTAGMGQGFVVLAAARAADRGLSVDAVVRAAEQVSQRVQVLVTLDTLEYLAKTSRIPQVAAFLGGVLAIKPVIQISDGAIHPIARVRTRSRSITYLFTCMRQLVPVGARIHVAVQHAHAPEEAAAMEARVRAEYDCVEVYTTEFTPVMGGYCGPGLLGLAFYADDPGDNEGAADDRA